jgi:integral membrane protein (TIGR01906 family)
LKVKDQPLLIVRWLATSLFVIALPVALVLSIVRAVAHDIKVYEYSVDQFNVTEVTGIARSELVRASGEIIDYFGSDDELLAIEVVKDNRLVPLFNEREVLHMRDVKWLFERVHRLQIAALVYCLAYVGLVVCWARERTPRQFAQETLVAGLGMGTFIVVAGVSAVVGFDRLFEQFHLLSFDNDLWLLDPARDRLIQMFPQQFWFNVTALIGIVSLAGAVAIAGLSSLYLRWDAVRVELPKIVPGKARISGV